MFGTTFRIYLNVGAFEDPEINVNFSVVVVELRNECRVCWPDLGMVFRICLSVGVYEIPELYVILQIFVLEFRIRTRLLPRCWRGVQKISEWRCSCLVVAVIVVALVQSLLWLWLLLSSHRCGRGCSGQVSAVAVVVAPPVKSWLWLCLILSSLGCG